jgi:hypothetical protein
MMRVSLVALAVVAATASAAPKNQDLAPIRNIYLMPMANGLDQYLANRISVMRRFAVVTDAAVADAIMTDRLGRTFEVRWAELYPPPPKDEDDEKNGEREGRVSNFGGGRGNIFLVDRHTRNIVWSNYKLPRNTQPDELDRLAEYFAEQLQKQAAAYTPRAVAPPAPPTPPAPAPPAAEPPAPPTPESK